MVAALHEALGHDGMLEYLGIDPNIAPPVQECTICAYEARNPRYFRIAALIRLRPS